VAASRTDLLWSPGYTAPFITHCPQAVTIPDMQYRRYPEDLTPLARLATDILVRMVARRCRRIIAISEFSRREILNFTAAGEESVRAIPLAADPAFARPIPEDVRRQKLKALLTCEKPYILCIANTYPHKNVYALIHAFGGIMERIPHQLVLVGKPRLGEPEVQSALRQISAPGRIRRLQRVEQEDLCTLYQGADLFVFPSLYEGFGLPVLEAMMSGVPVLTTKCGSIPEVGGDKVRYFDHADTGDLSRQILEILSWTDGDRKNWIQQGRNHSGQFSWEQTALKTIEFLKEASNARG